VKRAVKREARVITSLCDPAARSLLRDWPLLSHEQQPFLQLGFLAALEESGSVNAASGWQAHHLALFEADELVAFAPTYLKAHSHGEFVFDFSWADAYQRHGLAYYPKLLTAVPYSPISGARLLVRQGHPQADQLRAELVDLALQQCRQLGVSSWHCNFTASPDLPALQHRTAVDTDQEGLLPRFDWQFHWHSQGFGSFAEFLATLRSKKRKNMLRDRRLVHEADIQFRRLKGNELSECELGFVYTCYQNTFLQHGNHPALTRRFFELLAERMPESILVVLAERAAKRDREPIAMSFFLQGGGRLYGRYWGCVEEVPGLHFETAYHQGIEHCIAEGLTVFEPGAQGEHKISRGFSPVKTRSFHYIRDVRFSNAIARYLQQEAEWMGDYRVRLEALLPFRHEELNP
jgi:predicted N-acyltransferase